MKRYHHQWQMQKLEQEKYSVRNHLFILNFVTKQWCHEIKKEHIDINIMGLKQMFDTKELPIVQNPYFKQE